MFIYKQNLSFMCNISVVYVDKMSVNFQEYLKDSETHDSKNFIVNFNYHIKNLICLQLHIKMPVIRLIIQMLNFAKTYSNYNTSVFFL